MPFCHNCGTEVSPQATVCHKCSTILSAQINSVPQQQVVQPIAPPVIEEQPAVQPTIVEEQQPVAVEPQPISAITEEQPVAPQPVYQQPVYQHPYQQPVYQQPVYQTAPEFLPASGKINVGMLVWSIINNTVGLLNPLFWFSTMVLSVIALVKACTAPHAASSAAERKKNKTAMILNIIASAIMGFILLTVFVDAVETSAPSIYYDI